MEMKDKVWQGELLGHKNIGYKRHFECSHTEGTQGDSAPWSRPRWSKIFRNPDFCEKVTFRMY